MRGEPVLRLQLDGAPRMRARKRLLGAVSLFSIAFMLAAICFTEKWSLLWTAIPVVAGVVCLWSWRPADRDWDAMRACADDALPDTAELLSQRLAWPGRRILCLRTRSGETLTWDLIASWGAPVRLDRTGTTIAVLACRGTPSLATPLLEAGMPFLLQDYAADGIVALLADDVPRERRSPEIAHLSGLAPGSAPPIPVFPLDLPARRAVRVRWWICVGLIAAITASMIALAIGGDEAGGWALLLGGVMLVAAPAIFAIADLPETAALRVHGHGIEVQRPGWSGTVPWEHVTHVTLRFWTRKQREASEELQLGSMVVGSALVMVAGPLGHAGAQLAERIMRGPEDTELVASVGARLLAGELLPDIDDIAIELHRNGRRLPFARSRSRRRHQPFRALLRECAARRIPVHEKAFGER